MSDLWIIFLTGLTTGGLSCLAVQGGLLASSVAKQAEDDLANTSSNTAARQTARPILLFLSSKLVAYTLFGALLGVAGSMLQLTPYMRAAVQIIIGLYMLGLAMHLLGIHPIFRYFMPQPPRALTRYIRRKAKSGNDDLVTPAFLGALTVFIPCGVTVAMMALAVGTGNALAGAAVMLAFTLGTTPLFFTLAYTAAKLGARKQALFLKFAAVAVLVLGLISVEGGLNLAGSPVSFAAAQRSFSSPKNDALAAADDTQPVPPLSPAGSNPYASNTAGSQLLRMTAGYATYSPAVIKATANVPSKLEITSKDNEGCGRAFTVPSLGIQEVLPENGVVTVDLPAHKKGTLEVMCTMGMYFAEIEFE